MPELNICADIEILADEYFHGEISPEDEKIMREHTASCENCAEFYENEKKYYEEIKTAEYVPEINIAEAVMNKIIAERIIINKPAKKRFVPFGLISAAVIVLVMLFASRDNFNLVYDNMAAQNEDGAESILEFAGGGVFDGGADYNILDDADIGAGSYENDLHEAPEMRGGGYNDEAVMPEEWEEGTYDIITAEDSAEPVMPAAAPVVEVPAAAPVVEAESAVAGVWNAGDMPVSEVIKIKRGTDEDFIFSETVREYMLEALDGSLFLDSAYRDILIADLDRHDIDYEIEDMRIEAGLILIIYIN